MNEQIISPHNSNTLYKYFSVAILVFEVIALLCGIFNDGIKPILLLPVSYSLLFFSCRKNRYYFSSYAIFIINVVCFFRYVLYPTYTIAFYNMDAITNDIEVILIMIYELIGVFVTIEIFSKKTLSERSSFEVTPIKTMGISSLCLLALFLPLIVIEPSLLNRFNVSMSATKSVVEGTSGVITSFFQMSVWVLFVFLIVIIYKLFNGHNGRPLRIITCFLCFILACVYTIMASIGAGNVKRWEIIANGLGFAYLLFTFFPEYKKKLTVICVLVIVIGAYLGTFLKWDIGSVDISKFFDRVISFRSLDDYFAGIRGIREGLNMIEVNPNVLTFNCTLTDFLGQIPIISRLFNASAESSVAYYHAFTGRMDNICPMVVQSVAHFGIAGAPIVSMIFTLLSLWFNKMLNSTNNLYAGFVLTISLVYLALFMILNMAIELTTFWIKLLFLLIIKFDYPVKLTKQRYM